jgi:hypothetical protein
MSVGLHGVIKSCDKLVVPELFGKTGTITKEKIESMAEWNSTCKAYHNTPCPDRVYYWLQFDEPMTAGNHAGWRGVWIEKVDMEGVFKEVT